MFNSSENIKKQINMENRLIPFSNFDDVKVGDKVVLHIWETTNNETKHHFYRDKVITVGQLPLLKDGGLP